MTHSYDILRYKMHSTYHHVWAHSKKIYLDMSGCAMKYSCCDGHLKFPSIVLENKNPWWFLRDELVLPMIFPNWNVDRDWFTANNILRQQICFSLTSKSNSEQYRGIISGIQVFSSQSLKSFLIQYQRECCKFPSNSVTPIVKVCFVTSWNWSILHHTQNGC